MEALFVFFEGENPQAAELLWRIRLHPYLRLYCDPT